MRTTKKAAVSMVAVLMLIVGLPVAASAAPGTQRSVILLGGDDDRVIAAGPVSGVGTLDTESHEFDPEDGTVVVLNRFVFEEGSLLVTFTGHGQLTPIPQTCVTRTAVDGTFVITGGTGAYEGASGNGTFTDRGTLVTRRGPEGCSEDGIFRAVIRATGTTMVPDAAAAAA